VHGIEAHSGFFKTLGEEMAKEGSEVYAFDRRGFGNSVEDGLSKGDTKDFKRHLQDFDDFVSFVKKSHPGKKLFMLGHSIGCAYTLWYAASHAGALNGIVLAAPPVTPSTKPPLSETIKFPFLLVFSPRKMYNLLDTWSQDFRDTQEFRIIVEDPLCAEEFSVRWLVSLQRTLFNRMLANGAMVKNPVLIIQGEADNLSLPQGSKKLYEALLVGDKSLELFPEANHHFYRVIFPGEPLDAHTAMHVTMVVTDWLSSH
jgi:alpha-beta hydrolase superfamily lysophospholipase